MGTHPQLLTRGRRRFLFTGLAMGALISSMVWTVRRTTDARLVTQAIDSLVTAQTIQRAQLGSEMRRADSLASRSRLLDVARRFGLRPASDEEISFVRDEPTPASGGDKAR